MTGVDTLKATPLRELHVAAGAKLVPFAGWSMPLHYGSQVDEHQRVRGAAGMFDVSHMTIIDLHGPGTEAYLRTLLANDVSKLVSGQGQYGAMLNDRGGVMDDLIAYRRAEGFRLVTNAGTHDRVLPWLAQVRERVPSESLELKERGDLAILAVQGPGALERLTATLGEAIAERVPRFCFYEVGERMVARTGYTGEDGAELILPRAEALQLWSKLADAGVSPIGLAARDTLRLEAGLNLYGLDMDEAVSPFAANLGWTLAFEDETRCFVGRAALEAERKAGINERLRGLVMQAKGVLRSGYAVHTEAGVGTITSGLHSPTLGYSIALARLPAGAVGAAEVDIRGRRKPVTIVKPPFVRKGVAAWRPFRQQSTPSDRSPS